VAAREQPTSQEKSIVRTGYLASFGNSHLEIGCLMPPDVMPPEGMDTDDELGSFRKIFVILTQRGRTYAKRWI
jgi:hypothetical protein